MEDKIFENLDKAITINHKIVSYFIEMSKKENEKNSTNEEKILKNPILKSLFESEQECYRKIYDQIAEYENSEEYDIDVNVENIINILKDYATESYENLKYVSRLNIKYDLNGNIASQEVTPYLYENDEYKDFRVWEVLTTYQNLENVEIRNGFELDLNDLISYEKENIIYDMSEKKFYKDYAIEQTKRYISDLEKNKDKINSEDYSYEKQKLMERKYMYYYSYLNTMYNGILQENEIPGFRTIKRFVDDGLDSILLDMDNEEIKKSIDINLRNNKEKFKKEVMEILGSRNLPKTKMQKDKNEEKIEEEAEK